MIFESEPNPIVHETNSSNAGNIGKVSQVISFSGEKSFILNSLQRIKNSSICELKKKILDTFISEYTANFSGYVENDFYNMEKENYKVSQSYAKSSFEKVIRDQEYLHKIITTLNLE